jgi:hypothetical protein
MRKVVTFEHLENLARKRKSVICLEGRVWARKRSPAAFMMQLNAVILHHIFRTGLYVYYPAKGKKHVNKGR